MGTMRIKVAHRLFPRTWRILVWHREHSLYQIGNRSGILGLFFSGDRPNTTCRVVARYATRSRRAWQYWRGRFRRTARAGLLIEVFHFFRPQCRDLTHFLILRRSASARKPASWNYNGPRSTSRLTAVMRSHAAKGERPPDRHRRDPDLCNCRDNSAKLAKTRENLIKVVKRSPRRNHT